ncbi:MAG: methyltransferase [Candidatus Aenigmatarchaeota archaeon]|jgi:predicted methyltransferase
MEISFFDEKTKKFYKLVKTETWPTLEISGIHMHRIKDVDPKTDTELKIKSLGKIYGKILDICTGLGYTAILVARNKKVEKVITIEKDKNVIKIAKQNEFSKELFENPKIEIIIGDAFEEVKKFENESFNFIIHDPPRFSLAPELYSQEFYNQLFRVLKKGGKMFHYTGEPGKLSGKNYLKGIVKRLLLAGFKKVIRIEKAKGFLVLK